MTLFLNSTGNTWINTPIEEASADPSESLITFVSMSRQEIESLSSAEKILLVEQIWDSINKDDLELKDAHKAELDRRLVMHQRGETQFSTWAEVKQRISKR